MAGLYDGLEETAFKRVAGGYVFQSRNPWFIGPSRRYLATEAQKTQIARCLRETFQRMKPYVLATAVAMPVALGGGIFWLISRGFANAATIVLLTLALFVPYVAAVHVYSMRRLRPLIAALPRTRERITAREGAGKAAASMSFKLILLVFLGPALLVLANGLILIGAALDGRSLHNPAMFAFSTAMCLMSAGYATWLMILRKRAMRSAG
jgi:hypothetical protein